MRRIWLCLFALTVAVAASPAAAAPGAPPGDAVPVASAPAAGPSRVVTLVTGDRVVLHGHGKGQTFTFVPAAGRPPHGYVSSQVDGRLRVTPGDVATLVPEVLDPALFEITTLVEEQPQSSTTIPLIWRMGPGTQRTELPRILSGARALRSIDAEGVELPKAAAEEFGAALVRARDTRGALPDKIWLDRRGKVALDRNLGQIGAPPVWTSGWDGTGVTIAILDSGVDVDHPDLQGRVDAVENFMDSSDPLDRTGHGTHVASIAAGSGAASGGERRGVAFGSRILAAKVIEGDGTGSYSATIAAAEWAVANGADVVNMSLAFPGGDPTDPLVAAIESLTRTSGTLFVAAAGNEGVRGSIVSPGTAPSALTVGAVDSEDDHAGFSSRGPLLTGGPLKPEITAPGVNIVAAATSHGAPGGDFPYTALSGTSMAAPHVAGAAAVVMQRHPDWTPAQVKAALVGTAQEQPDAGAYDEGGGRLWLPDAVAATVVPDTPPVDFGFLPYPHTGATLTRQLSFTNVGAESETIQLSTQLPPGSGTAMVTPSTLTLAPGTTGTAALTVEAGADIGPGQHAGEVVATGGDVPVGLPFGYEREPERYDVTVQALGADGGPNPHAMVTVLDVEDMTRFNLVGVTLDETGVGMVRVPPGRYHVEAVIDTPDERNGGSMAAWVVHPEVVVDGPTQVVLDARTAHPVHLSVRGSVTSRDFVQVHERRDDATGSDARFSVSAVGPVRGVAVAATEPAATGRLDTFVSGRVAAPHLRLGSVREAPIPVGGAGTYVGRARLPVIDVGRGTDGEIAAAGVSGALVVVSTRGEPVGAVLRATQAAGAALVVLANDTDQPWQTFTFGVDVPAVTVTQRVAEALVTRRTVRVRGSAMADPSYQVVRTYTGSFPTDPRYVLSRSDVRRMARVDTGVAAIPATGPASYAVIRTPLVPGFDPTPSVPSVFPQPGLRRTELLQAGSWVSTAYRSDGRTFIELTAPPQVLDERDQLQETWFRSPWRPLTHFPSADADVPAVSRSSDVLNLNLLPFADAEGHLAENALADSGTATYTVTVDGEQLEPVPGPFAAVPLPPARVDLELQYDVDAGDVLPSQGRSRTVWRFSSVAPDDGQTPQPLLEPDLQLPIDLRGTLVGGDVTVQVARPGGTDVVLTSLDMEVSTDGGATWAPVTTERTGAAGVHAHLPELPADSTVAVRVSAVDADGESVQQTLWEAARTAAE